MERPRSNNDREQVSEWIDRVSRSLTVVNREEAEAYQMLDAFERWALVENACRRAGRWLDPHQRQRIEDRAEADHRRFDALMREIRARLDG